MSSNSGSKIQVLFKGLNSGTKVQGTKGTNSTAKIGDTKFWLNIVQEPRKCKQFWVNPTSAHRIMLLWSHVTDGGTLSAHSSSLHSAIQSDNKLQVDNNRLNLTKSNRTFNKIAFCNILLALLTWCDHSFSSVWLTGRDYIFGIWPVVITAG